MFDKFRYALSLFDSNEILLILFGLVIYHLVILVLLFLWARGSMSWRIRSLESERDEFRRNWQNRDAAWKDREDELRRRLSVEREKEVSQIKAEYDTYINLLEQKLLRARTREV